MKHTAPLRVLLAGADISTLTLALLLEHAGIDYLLLEPSDSVPVAAGGITLHPTVLPLLEQLSLRDDLLFFSQPMEQTLVTDVDMETITAYDWSDRQKRYGAWSRFMSRPEYCNMILEKLPESRVLFNAVITSVSTVEREVDHDDDDSDNDDGTGTLDGRQDSILDTDDTHVRDEKGEASIRGVTVECADGSVYRGHVLIGDIDSEVERKLMYNSDSLAHEQGLQFDRPSEMVNVETPAREIHYHVSGITEALDPQRIPLLKEDTTQLRVILDPKNSVSWWAATLVDRRIAWQVTKRVPLSEKSSRPSEFSSLHHEQAAAAAVINQISPSMMCPLGGTMAQLLNWTPQSQLSCKRWDDRRTSIHANSSRVLLLGEACRKMVPVLGQGADETIQDALALAEALYLLPSTRLKDIRAAFDHYHRERSTARQSAIDESRDLDLTLNAKGMLRKLYRNVMLNYLPKCIYDRKSDEKYSYRPQADFLDLVPDYGLVRPSQWSYARRHGGISFMGEGGLRREKSHC